MELQHYHWLFLTPTENYGWRLVLMFSSLGNAPANQPPSPPQDTSQGVIAQAVRLWLRDCRAGSIDSGNTDPGNTDSDHTDSGSTDAKEQE
ncbi:MAG: hypothetical protein HC772_18640 [Leptolyngbyaceae cyanobacterium CRU_2_3]|nr:hypothetical protein [Leptolyngbyaceae cyanobacterium CRU_2_3]